MGVNRSSSYGRQEPRREWYPSGPWIGGRRPYESSSNTDKATKLPKGNPDPSDYKIIKAKESGNYLIIKIQYPNCTNFEGNKILVFKGTNLIELVNQKLIDPHFFNDVKYKSPIARFVPTDEGWKMAELFASCMNDNE